MATHDLLTSTQAAAYLGVTRQAVSMAAKAGKVGTRYGAVYMFTRDELDRWRAERHPGGRPKSSAPSLSQPAGAIGS